ncbi:MAG: beta-glucosidase, partial [Gemmatimonadetes bacterium]|nr:beta-glucosidase [Gemmatimonadota bacterium]
MPLSPRSLAVVLFLFLAPPAAAQGVEARVDSLLRRMTLEEKVGEMTQLTLGAVSVGRTDSTPARLDSARLEELVVRRGVGSLLNVWDVAHTARQWHEVITTIQRFAARRRVPVPVLYGIDAVHGHHYLREATVFPQNVAMAATWNPALMLLTSRITAYETRASGIPWNFSPVLDLGRQPLWSRFPETFGEDVHLASVMGVAAVQGTQEDPMPAMRVILGGGPLTDPLLATPRPPRADERWFVAASGKHFVGYSMPHSGKDRTTAWIPDRQLHEYFVPPFRAAIDAGLATIMVNSADVNGVPVHASRELLTDLLRVQLGFRGVVVSDWEDIIRLQTLHHVAPTRLAAVRMALDAGIDMSMVPYSATFIDDVLSLVHAGAVTESRIDESVRRILRLKIGLGLFEGALPDSARLATAGAARSLAVSRLAAEQAVTLLENRGHLLPLARGTRLLVTGPGATSRSSMYGGWSYSWQGTDSTLFPASSLTLLDALRGRGDSGSVAYVGGVTNPADSVGSDSSIAAAVRAAADADVVLVALAEPASAEKPGDIDDLAMPAAQLKLAQALLATGKPVVLTLFTGRPRTIRSVVDSARAIVLGYQSGPYAGDAMAAVLYGAVNPAGRLPYTYPRSASDIEPYDHLASATIAPDNSPRGFSPEWPFGHGLSYTRFQYGDLVLDHAGRGVRDTVTVSVAVRNAGTRAGDEVVQLYVRQLTASVSPPVRRLRDFQRITLGPGEGRTVTFRLP